MAVSKNACIVVFVTAPDEQNAAAIGRALVEEHLAACANLLGPIRSIYRWEGAVEDAPEHLIVIKTRASLFAQLQARVRQLHPYQVPEIVALRIQDGLPQYLRWIGESTRTAKAGPQTRTAGSRSSAVSGGRRRLRQKRLT
jgi:periplasmic divalent cation tolerance protein